MMNEIADGGMLLLSMPRELRDFSIVDVRDARRLQEGIVEISYLGFRVRMDNKGIECEHPAAK
jgi:hypothetical protein